VTAPLPPGHALALAHAEELDEPDSNVVQLSLRRALARGFDAAECAAYRAMLPAEPPVESAILLPMWLRNRVRGGT